jgi:hypothetical protein
MSHSNDAATTDADASGPSYDDVNTPVIVVIGFISAIVSLLVIMLVQGMTYHLQNRYLKQVNTDVVATSSRKIVDEQKAALETGEGITPISEAMKTIVSTYNK